jgi:Tfp pilus assembly protein PilN
MSAARSIPSVVRSYQGNPYRVGRWADDELLQERLFLDTELANLDRECEYPDRLETTRAYLLAERQMVSDELERRARARILLTASTDLRPYWEKRG